MAESDTVFSGSIPDLYDAHMVPMLFEPYAADLAARVVAGPCDAVLETAAGSGVVARALAPLLPAAARYVVTDLSQQMLDRAAARQPGEARITWQQADALELPAGDAVFDVVCCQFGVMFFPDRVAGHREALRVLRPGGRLIFNVWDRIETNAFTATVVRAVAGRFPKDPSQFMERIPHGYHDPALIEADLRTAGFGTVSIEPQKRTSRAPSARSVAIALCQGTPMRSEIVSRDPDALDEVTGLAEKAVAASFGSGPVAAPMQAFLVTASA